MTPRERHPNPDQPYAGRVGANGGSPLTWWQEQQMGRLGIVRRIGIGLAAPWRHLWSLAPRMTVILLGTAVLWGVPIAVAIVLLGGKLIVASVAWLMITVLCLVVLALR